MASPVPALTASPPQRFSFNSPSSGWGIAGGCAERPDHRMQDCEFQAVVTEDAGRTWRDEGPKQSFQVTAASPRPEAVIGGPTRAWLQGDHPLVTFDRGKTWRSVAAPSDLQISSSDGLAWGVSSERTIMTSRDGVTWQTVDAHPPGVADAVEVIPIGTGASAFALGGEAGASGGELAHMARTDDGGRTWTSLSVPFCAIQGFGRDLRQTAGGDLWFVCGETDGAMFAYEKLYRSADNGAHWSLVADNYGYPTSEGGVGRRVSDLPVLGKGAAGLEVSPSGALFLIAGGQAGAVMSRSTDGGQHWRTLSAQDGYGLGNEFVFADAQHGWVSEAASHCLYRTVDGGASWAVVAGHSCPALR